MKKFQFSRPMVADEFSIIFGFAEIPRTQKTENQIGCDEEIEELAMECKSRIPSP